MSKLIFGLIAFTCLIASVSAGPVSVASASSNGDATNVTLIQYGTYTDSACTTPTGAFAVSNSTAGQCNFNAQSFTDGSFVYIYQFTTVDSTCAPANISSVVKIAAGVCGASVSYTGGFTMYTIFTRAVTPPAPTFPPTGFTTQTQYVNASSGSYDNSCSSSTVVVIASPPRTPTGPCEKSESGLFSSQVFLDSTCTTGAQARYSDPTCTNVVQVTELTLEFKACNYGVKIPCTGTGIPSFPSTLTLGATQFDNNQCITNSKTQVTAVLPGGCFEGTAVSCATVNGTQQLAAANYQNANCTGNVIKTDYLPTGMCIQGGDNANMTATCSAAPIGPGASSSSTGGSSGNGTSSSSSGPNSSVGRSVSIGSLMMVMIIGFITIKMNA